MIFVFPMAGESSRFNLAGYDRPKYQLKLGDEEVFDRVIRPFSRFSLDNHFVFICKDDASIVQFVTQKCDAHSIHDFSIRTVREKTSGQAESVLLGLVGQEPTEPLLIFNIDTIHSYFAPISFSDLQYVDCDGVLEVFEDDGDHWSFARVENGLVVETSEKDPISKFASNGLYYFRSVELFRKTYEEYFSNGRGLQAGERYIAPMYNEIIASGGTVKVTIVDKEALIFAGTPDEYEAARIMIEQKF